MKNYTNDNRHAFKAVLLAFCGAFCVQYDCQSLSSNLLTYIVSRGLTLINITIYNIFITIWQHSEINGIIQFKHLSPAYSLPSSAWFDWWYFCRLSHLLGSVSGGVFFSSPQLPNLPRGRLKLKWNSTQLDSTKMLPPVKHNNKKKKSHGNLIWGHHVKQNCA